VTILLNIIIMMVTIPPTIIKGTLIEAITRGWKIGAAGAGDNHSGTWGTAYPARLAILANNLTRTDLLAAMQARDFFQL
jgi:hypothetical protein